MKDTHVYLYICNVSGIFELYWRFQTTLGPRWKLLDYVILVTLIKLSPLLLYPNAIQVIIEDWQDFKGFLESSRQPVKIALTHLRCTAQSL